LEGSLQVEFQVAGDLVVFLPGCFGFLTDQESGRHKRGKKKSQQQQNKRANGSGHSHGTLLISAIALPNNCFKKMGVKASSENPPTRLIINVIQARETKARSPLSGNS
jgi:hypothetical protein